MAVGSQGGMKDLLLKIKAAQSFSCHYPEAAVAVGKQGQDHIVRQRSAVLKAMPVSVKIISVEALQSEGRSKPPIAVMILGDSQYMIGNKALFLGEVGKKVMLGPHRTR